MICSLCYDEAQETYAKLAEEESHMQTLSGRRSNGLSPQSRRIATFAVILFALSGLISGFAVGAFVRPKHGGTANNHGGNGVAPIVQQTKTATPVAQPLPQTIRVQSVDGYIFTEVPNGTTYTLTAHLKPVLGADNQPVHATNLTCKLWLISRVPGHQGIYVPSDIAKNVAAINETFTIQGAPLDNPTTPIPGTSYPEEQQALNFDGATQQTQMCNTDGEVTWRYQVSPSVAPGKYTLVLLYDWSGKHWTWFWVDIVIRKANSD
jgi:hypothetical protein